MKKILIPTKPDDLHALCVKLALAKKGYDATLWYMPDFPRLQQHSFEISTQKIHWNSIGKNFNINAIDDFHVVWMRRPQKPVLPDYLHVDDIDNAHNQNEAFLKSFWQVIAPTAYWVNPIRSVKAVNCKLKQLSVAVHVGLNIPHSLFSNDPVKIKSFIDYYQSSTGVIYKTLQPTIWQENDNILLTYTKKITLNDLPSDKILQATPGIFQQHIKKAFELRITYFGNYYIAVKLKSQEHPRGVTDWRCIPPHELMIEEFDIPESIHSKCVKLMKIFGLRFGCFDFIVTPDNEYYFLEVNEQGQFLWIESLNPEIKMLDIFTEYLLAAKDNYTWERRSDSVSLEDFSFDAKIVMSQAVAEHISPGTLLS